MFLPSTKKCRDCKKNRKLAKFPERNNRCVDCRLKYNRLYRKINKKRINKQKAAYRNGRGRVGTLLRQRAYRERHYEKLLQKKREYNEKNRAKVNAGNKRYRKTKKGRLAIRAMVQNRRAVKRRAVPKWADLKKVREIYLNCPEGYHVDHIVPLRGKIVCGLHVENNLQYLLIKDNLRKGNRLILDFLTEKGVT